MFFDKQKTWIIKWYNGKMIYKNSFEKKKNSSKIYFLRLFNKIIRKKKIIVWVIKNWIIETFHFFKIIH